MGRVATVRSLLFLSTALAVSIVIFTTKITGLGVVAILAAMFNSWVAGLLIGAYPEYLPWRI